MKTIEKNFDAVEYMRKQRDKSSLKLSKMTKEEIILYYQNINSKSKIKPCA